MRMNPETNWELELRFVPQMNDVMEWMSDMRCDVGCDVGCQMVDLILTKIKNTKNEK